jgi:hypothetical protein
MVLRVTDAAAEAEEGAADSLMESDALAAVAQTCCSRRSYVISARVAAKLVLHRCSCVRCVMCTT